ncbi:MAG: glycosyltransferase family 2 protein [Acidobacteria bacterium]|nr:glycosyltransferase family 2 protein [Acidobacteriota bacterium]
MTNKQPTSQPWKSISVFFPAFNDEGSIASVVCKTLALLPSFTDDYEIIVVNDGSSDSTAAVLNDLARRHPSVKVIHHERNLGYGGALRTGFTHAQKDLIFYTDGDGQYDVNELAKLIPLMVEEVDVVNGYKIKRSDSKRRVVLGEIYKYLARLLFRLPIRDVDCDFRLIRRRAIQSIELVSTSGVVCTEMIYKLNRLGCRFAESPVHHYPRMHGQSQFFTLPSVARTAIDFFLLWLMLVVLQRLRRKHSRLLAKDSVGLEKWIVLIIGKTLAFFTWH